jgi:putative hydrolase of the HAD superfamily
LGETLIEYVGVRPDWQHQYPEALAGIAAVCGCVPTADQLATAVRVLLDANTRVTPRAHEIDHRQVFGEVVAALAPCAAGGCDAGPGRPDLVEQATDAFFALFNRTVRPMPGVDDLLDGLDRLGLPMWILTDVPYGMPRRLVLRDLDAAGLSRLAAVTTTSVEVGRRKPAPDGFLALARHLGVAPGRMWFVGNEHRDVAGAKAAGMTAVLLWIAGEAPPDWGQDLVVTTLTALLDHLLEAAPMTI